MTPKISVVVPIYNAENHIETCVKSITAQTLTDIEIILVDDGSADNSWELCKTISKSDNRIKVFTKDNGGASSARCLGVHNANGEYIAFVDVDDTMPSEALSLLYTQAQTENLDIIQGARLFKPLRGKAEHVSGFNNNEICNNFTYISYLFNGYCNAGPHGTLYKNKLFTEDTFDLDKSVRVGEDFYMNMALGAEANRIGLYNDVVYHYIENTESITHRYLFTSIKPQILQAERIKSLLTKHGIFNRFAVQYYQFVIGNFISACLHNKTLIRNNELKPFIKEAEKLKLNRRSELLLQMLKHPVLYPLFYIANRLRQLLVRL